MVNLTIIEQQGKYLVDSREVAKMTEKNHNDLLRSIKGYMEVLGESNFTLSEFFIESSYTTEQNKVVPCYLLTRKGCDMVANKMTGEKGVLFTAAYVTEFERMTEQRTSIAIPQVEVDMVIWKYAVESLRPSEASKIRMLTTICKNHNANHNFLPSYTEELATRSTTELLKKHGSPMSAVAFNKALMKLGIVEEQTRNSTGGTKKFKSLTVAGLYYGKNLVSTVNEKETQIHLYVEKFEELLGMVIA